MDYEYELRRGGTVIATGRLQLDQAPTPGEKLSLGKQRVRVEDVLRLGKRQRLILRAD